MVSFLRILNTGLVLLASTTVALAQGNSPAAQALNNGSAASGHASASAGHSLVASGQLTSAALAVPLMSAGVVAGSVGGASAGSANQSMRAATAPIGTPLEVTDESITVISPKEALKPKSPSL
ncbi:hypothetical protein [Rhodoferax sp. U11-2br]|uniref:hypothetical protein n=1 Tax=Rhodoferax sp. U11-2br TaxID=2838878 RepID=UPI001BE85DDF|nr:hypothetical protein [Rhodoferax sp. U11-2br]MBT3065970.1 hypothetical protein [Rhodoferax sp. U11-2br]